MNYQITCESTADLNMEYLKEMDVPFACFTFLLNGTVYDDNYGQSYPLDQFYKDVEEGAAPTTSQVNYEKYIELFEPILKQGKNVLHISLSSAISGTFNGARLVASELNEKYNKKVYVIDSLNATSGYGLLVKLARDNQLRGANFEENIEYVEDIRDKINGWVVFTDLTCLIRGGRLSKTAGAIGTVLKICPVIEIAKDGSLQVRDKIRTKKKAYSVLCDIMAEKIDNGTDYDGYIYVAYTSDLDDAKDIYNRAKEKYPKAKEINIFQVGTTIGAHAGPGAVAYFFVGQNRQ